MASQDLSFVGADRPRFDACRAARAAGHGRRALAALAGAVLVVGLARPAAAQGLADLESAALAHAQELRLVDTQTELAAQQFAAARAQEGPRVTMVTALSQNREPLSATTSRDYARTSAVAGLRWPLLGSAESAAHDTENAELRLEQQAVQRRQVQADMLVALRSAYVALLNGRERQALSAAWLQQRAQVEALLLRRTRAHVGLEADRLAFEAMFDAARRDQLRDGQAADRALVMLQRLTELPLADLHPVAPGWTTACLLTDDILARAEERPAVAMAVLAVRARERQLDKARWAGIEAGVTLSQQGSHDFGGLNGHATTLGIDLNVPLDLQAWRNAQRAQRRLALEEARLVLQARRADDATQVQDVLGAIPLAEAQWRAAAQTLAAAREADRVARLRAASLDGDVLEAAARARYALYRAAMDASESLQRLEQAQAAAFAYATDGACASRSGEPATALPEALAATLVDPLPVVASRPVAARMADAIRTAPDRTPVAQPVAWFAWDAQRLLGAPDPGVALPAPGTRLLVSLRSEEIARVVADASAAQRLRTWLAALHDRGWRVDLLLGEPTWVDPAPRARLLALLRSLASFPFDGLALDLERSQLAPAGRRDWQRRLIATLRAVNGADSRPLALVTHWRELARPGLGRALKGAGVLEAMAMVYTTDLARATASGEAVARALDGLPLVLVQSVERTLPAEESTFSAGRAASLTQWRELAARLASQPGFEGIAVQSLEDWDEAAP